MAHNAPPLPISSLGVCMVETKSHNARGLQFPFIAATEYLRSTPGAQDCDHTFTDFAYILVDAPSNAHLTRATNIRTACVLCSWCVRHAWFYSTLPDAPAVVSASPPPHFCLLLRGLQQTTRHGRPRATVCAQALHLPESSNLPQGTASRDCPLPFFPAAPASDH